jgi:hypothetical protein
MLFVNFPERFVYAADMTSCVTQPMLERRRPAVTLKLKGRPIASCEGR